MNPSGNTILITGGGSGIGRGLAESFHALGNQVVIAGRRRQALDETTAANPGMKALTVDVRDPASLRALAAQAIAEFPALNVLINNAGIMRPEKLLAQQPDLADAEAIVATNLLGPIRLTAALLPHLQKQPRAAIVNVSSGLAFLPMARTPTYCATKAAIHSYTLSLRCQLRSTGIEVLELIPPYVATRPDGRRRQPARHAALEVHRRGHGDPQDAAHAPRDLRRKREAPPLRRRKRQLRRHLRAAQRVVAGFAPLGRPSRPGSALPSPPRPEDDYHRAFSGDERFSFCLF